MKVKHISLRLATLLILSSSLAISGCSKEEAQALKGTAKLFSDESNAAIDATETMIMREVQEAIPSNDEARSSFFRAVLRQELSDQDLALNLDRLMKPPQPSSEALGNLRAFMSSLREQYGTLAAIYDDVERGHLLAKSAVQKSKVPLEKLTVQMAYLSTCVAKYPAVLIKDKSKILSEIITLRRKYFAASSPVAKKDIESKLYDQFLKWQQIEITQQELTQNVLQHSIKAAMLGKELREQIDHYNKITLESLNSLLVNVVDIASTVSGQDYSGFKKQASDVWQTIYNDQDFRWCPSVSVMRL
jgi:hypothetical protein